MRGAVEVRARAIEVHFRLRVQVHVHARRVWMLAGALQGHGQPVAAQPNVIDDDRLLGRLSRLNDESGAARDARAQPYQ